MLNKIFFFFNFSILLSKHCTWNEAWYWLRSFIHTFMLTVVHTNRRQPRHEDLSIFTEMRLRGRDVNVQLSYMESTFYWWQFFMQLVFNCAMSALFGTSFGVLVLKIYVKSFYLKTSLWWCTRNSAPITRVPGTVSFVLHFFGIHEYFFTRCTAQLCLINNVLLYCLRYSKVLNVITQHWTRWLCVGECKSVCVCVYVCVCKQETTGMDSFTHWKCAHVAVVR